jgi:RecA-family ATPase
VTLAGRDAALATVSPNGIVKPTALFEALRNAVRDLRPRLVGIDTAADVFVIDERDRSQVRQCLSLLRSLCLDFGCAVVVLSHPSLSGRKMGTGESGSTAWNNSVRSRLYLHTPNKDDDTDDEDPANADARVLEVMKSNYGPSGRSIKLRFDDGLFVVDDGSRAAALGDRNDVACMIFLKILTRYNDAEDEVSKQPKANIYAPKVFSKQPESRMGGTAIMTKGQLEVAMNYLMQENKIHIMKLGPPSKQRERLRVGPKPAKVEAEKTLL